MARYTKNGSNVVNTWEGYTVTWYCKQVTDITVNTTTVDVTINVYAHFNNTANIYGGDMNGALVVDNKIVNRANPPDYHTAQDNEDWHLISRKVTYTRSTSEATHTISSWVAVTGGAWEGTSSNYNNRLTITIPVLPYYAISYDANGGTGAPSVGRKWYNQEYTVSSTKPTRTGYTFYRWKIKETGNTVYAGDKIGAIYNSNYTLVAEWSRNSYTLTYNANGGSVSPTSKTVSYESTYGTLPTPSRTGYDFKGWFTTSTGDTRVYSSTKMGASNTTIYAQWIVKSYTLTYDAHGGNVSPTSKSVVYNTNYGDLPEPTKTGYNFIGWFTEASGGLQVSSSTKMGAADVTIHAQWELAYIPPSLYISNAKRVRKEGTRYVEDDTGTIANVIFTWSDGAAGDDSSTSISPDKSYDIILTEQVDENPEVITVSNLKLMPSPVSVYLYDDDNDYSISAEKSFDVEVILHVTGHDDVSARTYISQAFFIMDVNKDGTAIGFGGAVKDEDKGIFLADNNGVFRALFDYLYPIGSYYETSDSTFNPNVTWGGTWILETEGLVHIGAGDNYTLGDTGGNKDAIIPYHKHSYTAPPSSTGSHTLTIDEIPSHSHSFTYAQYQRGTGSSTASALEYSGSTKTTDSKGGGKGHSHTIGSGSSAYTGDAGTPGNLTNANMQPYVVVNRWHRTA